MAGCCSPGAYGRTFDAREARKNAERYRKKGLDPTARHMVEYVTRLGVAGQTVLEVGGGVGAIQVELLRAGAARAVNVELSPGYEDAARTLLAEAGLRERVERRLMDFAREADAVAPADVVVMHRVICCYPDMHALVAAAAGRTRRYLAISFPRESWWMRLGVQAENLWQRLKRSDFRAYVHPPRAILATARSRGLRVLWEDRGWIWQTAVLEKTE